MKQIFRFLLLVPALTLSLTAAAFATVYSFSSNDGSGVANDLNDLDHNYLYVWAIDPSQMLASIKAKNERIISASISFKNIYNWQNESNDVLKVYLVDNPRVADKPTGTDIWSAADNQATSGTLKELSDPAFRDPTNSNYRFSSILKVWQWTDVVDLQHNPNPVTHQPNSYGHDLVYTLDKTTQLPTLLDYMNSLNPSRTAYNNYATFGLGFDPDCHYYNDGIKFIVQTAPICAPEPSTFMLLGAGLLGAGLFARRRRK